MTLLERVEQSAREHYKKQVDKLMDDLVNCKDAQRIVELKTRIKDLQS